MVVVVVVPRGGTWRCGRDWTWQRGEVLFYVCWGQRQRWYHMTTVVLVAWHRTHCHSHTDTHTHMHVVVVVNLAAHDDTDTSVVETDMSQSDMWTFSQWNIYSLMHIDNLQLCHAAYSLQSLTTACDDPHHLCVPHDPCVPHVPCVPCEPCLCLCV